jgi:Trp operon repressor
MTHVSRKKLPRNTRATIDMQLLKVFSKHTKTLVQELLTPTERLMLAKRLAILTMLAEHRSYYRIHRSLRVSVSTVRRMHTKFYRTELPLLHTLLKTKARRMAFMELLDIILRAGLPPKAGPGRWRNFFPKK